MSMALSGFGIMSLVDHDGLVFLLDVSDADGVGACVAAWVGSVLLWIVIGGTAIVIGFGFLLCFQSELSFHCARGCTCMFRLDQRWKSPLLMTLLSDLHVSTACHSFCNV